MLDTLLCVLTVTGPLMVTTSCRCWRGRPSDQSTNSCSTTVGGTSTQSVGTQQEVRSHNTQNLAPRQQESVYNLPVKTDAPFCFYIFSSLFRRLRLQGSFLHSQLLSPGIGRMLRYWGLHVPREAHNVPRAAAALRPSARPLRVPPSEPRHRAALRRDPEAER